MCTRRHERVSRATRTLWKSIGKNAVTRVKEPGQQERLQAWGVSVQTPRLGARRDKERPRIDAARLRKDLKSSKRLLLGELRQACRLEAPSRSKRSRVPVIGEERGGTSPLRPVPKYQEEKIRGALRHERKVHYMRRKLQRVATKVLSSKVFDDLTGARLREMTERSELAMISNSGSDGRRTRDLEAEASASKLWDTVVESVEKARVWKANGREDARKIVLRTLIFRGLSVRAGFRKLLSEEWAELDPFIQEDTIRNTLWDGEWRDHRISINWRTHYPDEYGFAYTALIKTLDSAMR